MRLYWDLDLGYLVRTPTTDTKLSAIEFKRGDAVTLDLAFYRAGVAMLLDAGFEIRFGLKQKGKYDSAPVVFADAFAENSAAKIYTARPSLNTSELNALLRVDGEDGNDLGSVELIGEFTYRIGAESEEWQSTQTLRVIVHNDVIRGQEGTPASANEPAAYAHRLLSARRAHSPA